MTDKTNPIPSVSNQSWNALRTELEKNWNKLNNIVRRFESYTKSEHAMSKVEFESQVIAALDCVTKGFETIIELTNIEPRTKFEPGSEVGKPEYAKTGTGTD